MKFYVLITDGLSDRSPWIRGPFDFLGDAQRYVEGVERPKQRVFTVFTVDQDGRASHASVGRVVPPSLPEFRWV
jgi:hypothetical protein